MSGQYSKGVSGMGGVGGEKLFREDMFGAAVMLIGTHTMAYATLVGHRDI